MNTITSPQATDASHTPASSTPTDKDDKGPGPVIRALGQLSPHLPAGVTPISLALSALAALLGGFGSSGVVAEQGSLVIAFVVLVGSQLAWVLWQKWSPKRLEVAKSRDSNAIHALAPYLSNRRPGAPSVAASLPDRTGEARAVIDMVTGDANVAILYGDAGSGKTSLVHGTVLPGLEALGWRVWYVNSLEPNPMSAVIQAGLAAGAANTGGATDWLTLGAMLPGADEPAPGVVVMLDNIERFFQRDADDAQRSEFWAQLGHVASGGVRVLLIGRTDVLPLAIEAGKRANAGLDEVPQHELKCFTRDEAIQAIVKVATASGLPLEERLPGGIARELSADNQVSPAHLQLVMDTLFWTGMLTLPGYVRGRGARGALRRFFDRWLDTVKDRGSDPVAQAAVLARLAGAEPRQGRNVERGGLTLEQLGASATMLNALVAEHLVERTRSGAYRLAQPGLAPALRTFGRPESWVERSSVALWANLSAGLAWCMYWPRMALGLVLATMLAAVGLVLFLIIAGYPQGRQVASLPVVLSAGEPALDLVAFDRRGRYLAADVGPEIIVWDLHNQNAVAQRLSKEAIAPRFVTNSLAFVGADEVRLYGVHGEVWAWQLSSGTFIRQDEESIPTSTSTSSSCSVSAATVNSTGRYLAEGTTCGVVRVLDVEARVEVQPFDHHDAKCRSLRMAFSRAENQLLEFYRCKSANDVIQLKPWSLGMAQPAADSTPGITGDLVKVQYLADGNPYILTVTQEETNLWEMARSLARSRWPLAVYDGAPTDLAPDGRVLAVGFVGEIRLYERAEWPFEFVPVKDSAKGLVPRTSPAPATQ